MIFIAPVPLNYNDELLKPLNIVYTNELPHWDATQAIARGGGEIYVDLYLLYVLRINDVSRNTFTTDVTEIEESEYL